MKLELVQDLYLRELEETYWSEQKMLKALPQLAQAVSTDELRNALEKHVEQTREQAERLKKIIQRFGESSPGTRGKAMGALLDQARGFLKEEMGDNLREAALGLAAARAESHEIACYAGLEMMARQMGQAEDASLLSQSLREEKAMQKKLLGFAQASQLQAAETEEPLPRSRRRIGGVSAKGGSTAANRKTKTPRRR
jgi:ferritin-like metal-binding protein YciE